MKTTIHFGSSSFGVTISLFKASALRAPQRKSAFSCISKFLLSVRLPWHIRFVFFCCKPLRGPAIPVFFCITHVRSCCILVSCPIFVLFIGIFVYRLSKYILIDLMYASYQFRISIIPRNIAASIKYSEEGTGWLKRASLFFHDTQLNCSPLVTLTLTQP